MENFEDL